MKRISFLWIALAFPGLALSAEPATWLGSADCRIAPLKPEPKRAQVSWSGKCADGHAEGPGMLKWTTADGKDIKIEATLARGQIAGEGTLTSDAMDYIGTFKEGIPHGAGYIKYRGGRDGLYEGGLADGKPDGKGVSIKPDGSEYEGEWKTGCPHGFGRAKFGLGGSYEGEWRKGYFDGKGAIVYAGDGHRYEGQFSRGRAVGSAPRDNACGEKQLANSLPIDASWADLTPAQQNHWKARYPALEEGDVPPYPLGGTRQMEEVLSKASYLYEAEGDLIVHVMVGTDGRAKWVKTMGRPHKSVNRYATAAAAAQRFTPAICRGKPCEMIFALHYVLTQD